MFNKFWNKKKEPAPSIEVPTLGTANWNEQQNGWVGNYNGLIFVFLFDNASQPKKTLTDYAESLIGNSSMFSDIIVQARNEASRNYSEFLKDEIEALQVGVIYFSLDQKNPTMIIDMLGGPSERPWRLDYRGLESLGLKFSQP